MRIKDIKVWRADLENTKPYTIAFKTVDEVLNAFVEITLDNGVTGIGSGNPSEHVTGEYFDSCIDALKESNIQFLIGRDIREINQLTYEIWQKLPANPAARAALDIALYDAFTKYLGVPLVKYLGQKIHSLPTSNTIGIKNVEETLKEAQEYGERGFKVLKVKLGRDLNEDIERMVKLREKFGDKFVIRIDANQGYTLNQTIEFYQKTKHLNIELIEQPLPAKSVAEMKQLPQEIRTIVAADESLLTPTNALDLVMPPIAAGIFNIKLMKCGGIIGARDIATIAQTAGTDLFWGCNDESIISITAALHVAYTSVNTKYLDLDGSFDLAEDLVRGGFELKDGCLYINPSPGFGFNLI